MHTYRYACSICRNIVKEEIAVGCMVCSHGGHMNHMLTWFAENEQCPSGCGCYCLLHQSSPSKHLDQQNYLGDNNTNTNSNKNKNKNTTYNTTTTNNAHYNNINNNANQT